MNFKLSHGISFARKEDGSSLIGVAILTLVMGFLMTGAIYLLQNYNTIKARQSTVDIVQTVQEGLDNFASIYKRYPCPARANIAPDQTGFGLEDCSIPNVDGRSNSSVKIGATPVRTLNIPDKMIADGYGKRHFYAITASITTGGPLGLAGGPDAGTALPNLKTILGEIILHDAAGHSVSNTKGFVTYALISPGTDDRGAYDLQGALIAPCARSGLASENCDEDGTFLASNKNIFRGEANDFTHSFAFKASTATYNWSTGNWSDCGSNASNVEWSNNPYPPPICFSSYQAREINCIDQQGNEDVTATGCAHTPPPETERACSLGPCSWEVRYPNCPSGYTLSNATNSWKNHNRINEAKLKYAQFISKSNGSSNIFDSAA